MRTKKSNRSRAAKQGHVDFSVGVRGKYARECVANEPSDMHIWAPLEDFCWPGREMKIASDTWIVTRGFPRYKDDPYRRFISSEEAFACEQARHWLRIVQPIHSELSPRVAVNSFLFSLWIARPTATHVALRFEEADSGEQSVARVLDRFQWIAGQIREDVDDDSLTQASALLGPLRDVYRARRRLRTAMVLTFRGCVSVDWQAALICFSAAAEALLTYERGRGLTDRLARAYAALGNSKALGVDEFRRLYDLRSAVVHGRAYERSMTQGNLNDLALFSNALRTIWHSVLTNPHYIGALEGTDNDRKLFFTSVEDERRDRGSILS